MDTLQPKPIPRQPARRRAPGRPGNDSPDLRQHLLDAALTCFSRQGIAATSLRAIATQANVNPALLHYYFGDKAQLQHAVIEERVMPAVNGVGASLAAAGDDVTALIAGFVRGVGEATRRPGTRWRTAGNPAGRQCAVCTHLRA